MSPFYSNALSLSRKAANVPYGINPFILPERVNPSQEVDTLPEALTLLQEAEKKIAEQAARIRRLENLAMTDELTGLMNRRGFMAALRRELAASRRTEKTSGLLVLIDLDGFKMINDTHGHMVGDSYLQSVASVLLNDVRSSDFVARLGGDEFAILLTGISAKEAALRLGKLEQDFHKRVMHNHGLALPLRASFGFALLQETETPESLIIAADMKLYASKAQRKRTARAS